MKFSDVVKSYREVYPEVKPKPRQLVETPTGLKDIADEVHEEVIDTTVERPTVETTPEENEPGDVESESE